MQDDQGANVLHIAAELNQSAAIVLFLETGTGASDSLDSKDRAGVTPLHRYRHYQHKQYSFLSPGSY